MQPFFKFPDISCELVLKMFCHLEFKSVFKKCEVIFQFENFESQFLSRFHKILEKMIV